MAYLRTKHRGNNTYHYLVKGIRNNGKVRQKVLKYYGTNAPSHKELAADILELGTTKAFDIKRQLIGYPFSPKVGERANCGPTVLAAILGSDTDEAIELMDHVYQKDWNGYTNIGHIRAALKYHDISMNKTKEFDGMNKLSDDTFPRAHVLLFLQIEGPWIEDKYWRAAYTRTHWCLAYAARILDVNNYAIAESPDRPQWLWIGKWQGEIIPSVVASFEGATGWHIRAGYYVKEGE